ncbi:hypothetical protein NTE_01368 [Candidatus Nitrososphaera evergladensis SR1]|uniref:Uncharacterized protein n=2 Tax=Nitrososphaera TaxID=497726 RepID=A0A075MPF5_9ARCH|nr:hypothetical protein NTE_01368 [Candidatus Nitrososphaera evergladensis SR1]
MELNDYYCRRMLASLEKRGKLGSNEFKRVMTAGPNPIMSERPFRERLRLLVEAGLVTRLPDKEDSGKVWYTLEPGILDNERALFNEIQERLEEMDRQYAQMEKNISAISTVDKAYQLSLAMRELASIEYRLWILKVIFRRNKRPKVLSKKIEELKGKLFHLTHIGNADKWTVQVILGVLERLEAELHRELVASQEEMTS